MPSRVLILYVSAGAGHMRASQAIQKAYAIAGGAEQVKCVDILDYSNRLYQWLQRDGYVRLVNKVPGLFGAMYDHFDRPWKKRGNEWFDRACTSRLLKMIKEYNPDVIISTHGTSASLVSGWLSKGQVSARHGIVVTDMDAHAVWLCRQYDQYFVAMLETKLYLERLGIEGDKITVSGIPIDPVFAENKDRQQLLQKYQLHADSPIILVSGGGFGMGPVERVVEYLLELQHPAQIVVLCGRNQALKDRIEMASKVSKMPHLSLQAIGYTDKVDEYMTLATLIVGKPGGLFSCEALAKGCVYVVIRPISGQETRNSDHLLENGAAIRCNNLPILAMKIDDLLADPDRLARMQINARKMSHPRSAFTVVERMQQLARS